MAETYVKTFTDPDEATAEAAGLEWLAEAEDAGGTRIARVLAHPEPRVLHLEQISDGAPTPEQAERFGRSLARTHAAGAPHWGAPSPGFPQQGSLRMGRSRTAFVAATDAPDSWGEFFAEYRIRDYVSRIVDQGGFDGSEAAVFERVAERLEERLAKRGQTVFDGWRHGREDRAAKGYLGIVTGDVEELTGRAPQSVADFLAANRGALVG